ncbi:MAG: group III truncated hemoglobin [Minwuia sp.]|nr:group III truncated hemoglobin [Minwuia sp.]
MTDLSASDHKAIPDEIRAMGIDDAYVSQLVDTFYGRVRKDPDIGPIFEAAIGDTWDHHLAKLKDFWASVAWGAARYSGQPVPAHQRHPEIMERHFDIWLGLFRQTLEDTAPTPAAVDHFMIRAERIARSLKLVLFGVPGFGGVAR